MSAPEVTDDEAARIIEWSRRTRREAGLPEHVEDEAVLTTVARMLCRDRP